jgi:hypothetical protein
LGACTGVSRTSAQNTSSKLRVNFASWVAQQQAQPSFSFAENKQQVGGLLGNPGAVRVGGHPSQVDPQSVQLDEEQDVQPPQPDGVDGEAGRTPGSRRPAGAGTPATSWWCDAGRGRVHDGGGSFGSPMLRPVPRGAAVPLGCAGSPPRVLPGQADDQLLQLLIKWWSSRPAVRVGPRSGDQPPVPAQQRLRPDEETRPAASRQHPASRGQEGPVS